MKEETVKNKAVQGLGNSGILFYFLPLIFRYIRQSELFVFYSLKKIYLKILANNFFKGRKQNAGK